MKRSRFHERVLANALGLVNNAMRPLKGAQVRAQKRSIFSGIAAVLSSFVGRWASSAKRGKQKVDRYPSGFNKSRENARHERQWAEGLHRENYWNESQIAHRAEETL